MPVTYKKILLLAAAIPSIGFSIQPGAYVEGNLTVNFGPSSVIADVDGFANSGGTISAGVSDIYGLNTRGAVGGNASIGYNVRNYLGVEANYAYWGNQTLSSFTGQMTTKTDLFSGHSYGQSVGGNVVGYLPVENDLLNIYAKVGLAALFTNLTVNDQNGSIFFNEGNYHQDTTMLGITYGIGCIYKFTDHVSGLLSWYGISGTNNGPISNQYYNSAAIGVRYSFASPALYSK